MCNFAAIMFSLPKRSLPGSEVSGPADTKEYNDVSNDNTTKGGSIWDNEW